MELYFNGVLTFCCSCPLEDRPWSLWLFSYWLCKFFFPFYYISFACLWNAALVIDIEFLSSYLSLPLVQSSNLKLLMLGSLFWLMLILSVIHRVMLSSGLTLLPWKLMQTSWLGLNQGLGVLHTFLPWVSVYVVILVLAFSSTNFLLYKHTCMDTTLQKFASWNGSFCLIVPREGWGSYHCGIEESVGGFELISCF